MLLPSNKFMYKSKYLISPLINFIKGLSILHIALLISLSTLIFLILFVTPKYKSSSIIDVSIEDESLVSNSFLNSFVSSGGSSESFKLKLFLESEEASKLLQNSIDVEEIFAHDNISHFSKFRNDIAFHDYLSSMIEVVIDPDSNAVGINSYAFEKEYALKLNLELINMVVNYLNRTARLTSFNSKTNRICDLYFINSDVLNNDAIFFEDDSTIPQGASSANELLLRKALNFKQFCSKSLDSETQTQLQESNLFPSFELNKLNVDASKKVLSQIYEDSIGSFASSNNIQIIAEPMIAEDYENRNILMFSFLSFICSYILLLGLKIISRLADEFYVK